MPYFSYSRSLSRISIVACDDTTRDVTDVVSIFFASSFFAGSVAHSVFQSAPVSLPIATSTVAATSTASTNQPRSEAMRSRGA